MHNQGSVIQFVKLLMPGSRNFNQGGPGLTLTHFFGISLFYRGGPIAYREGWGSVPVFVRLPIAIVIFQGGESGPLVPPSRSTYNVCSNICNNYEHKKI